MNKMKLFVICFSLMLTGCSYSGYYEVKKDQHQRNAEIYTEYTKALTSAVMEATKPVNIATISYNDNGKDRTITLTTPNYAATELVKTLITNAPVNINGNIKSPGEDFVSGLDSFGKIIGPALAMTPLAIAATKIASYNKGNNITTNDGITNNGEYKVDSSSGKIAGNTLSDMSNKGNTITTNDGITNNGEYKVDSSSGKIAGNTITTNDGITNNGEYKVDSSSGKIAGNELSNMNNNPDPLVVTTEKAVVVTTEKAVVVTPTIVNPQPTN